MVEARPVALEEAADRRLRTERQQQLDVAVAYPDQDRLDPLRLDRLAVLHRHPEPLRVERDGLVEVLHRHADVVHAPEHGRRGYLRSP
jgi:hypothetical protein